MSWHKADSKMVQMAIKTEDNSIWWLLMAEMAMEQWK